MLSAATGPSAAMKCPSPALNFPDGNRIAASFEALISRFSRSASGVSVVSFIFFSLATFIAITLPAWILSYSNGKKKGSEPIIPAAEVNGQSPEFEPISPTSFCEICLENKPSWQMFANEKCSHAFCYSCTQAHVLSKIQDRAHEIPCPAPNCKAFLNRDSCGLMVPNEALVRWDESICMSLIPESQKLYCPYLDCLTMLVNDSGEVVKRAQCLVCSRAFCGECGVPWHSKFTCREFRKVYDGKRSGREDRIVKVLAKKMSWRKCPRCRMYVEKSGGCVHMTCRCSYEFCYRCGASWSTHDGGKCFIKRWWDVFR